MKTHINLTSQLSYLDAFGLVQLYIVETLDGFHEGVNDAVIRNIVDSLPAATALEPLHVVGDEGVLPHRVIVSAIARELIRWDSIVNHYQKAVDEFDKNAHLPSSDFDESIKHECYEIGGVDLSAREWLQGAGMYDTALEFWRDSVELYELDAYNEIDNELEDALAMHYEFMDIANRIMGDSTYGISSKQALVWAYKTHSKVIEIGAES